MSAFLLVFLVMVVIQVIAQAAGGTAPTSPAPPITASMANDILRAQVQITNDNLRSINEVGQIYQRAQAEMMAEQNASAQKLRCALSGTPYVEVIRTR